jgi:hypothetical protein
MLMGLLREGYVVRARDIDVTETETIGSGRPER